jgi:membrane protein
MSFMPRESRRPRVRLNKATTVYMAKRVIQEFSRDGGTDHAAKLTYFLVLSIAPMLLAVFSLATLVLTGIQDEIKDLILSALPATASGEDNSQDSLNTMVSGTLDSLLGNATGGTIALIIGIVTALWSASAYVKAFARVANLVYDVPEGRGPIRFNGSMLAVTAGIVVSLVLVAISLLLSKPIAESLLSPIADPLNLQDALDFLLNSFLPVWTYLRWPVVLFLLFVVVSLLYWSAPNIAKPFRLVSPGGIFAVIGMGVAAVGIVLYMTYVASYSSYGAIGSVMAVLFALWIVNIVVVMGVEVDAEYERAKELRAGRPAERHVTIPLRADAGAEKKEAKHEETIDRGREIRLENLHHDAETWTRPEVRIGHGTGEIDTVDATEAADLEAVDAEAGITAAETADAAALIGEGPDSEGDSASGDDSSSESRFSLRRRHGGKD